MAIKAIALDIDGTLTNDRKVITPRTKEALLAAQDSGIKLILSSGRPVQGLRAIASELQLETHDGLLVAFNGAHVVDAQTDEVLFDQPMEEEVLRALVAHIRGFDVIPWITEGKYLFVERGARHLITYREAPFDIVEYERRMCDLELVEVDDLLEVCSRPQDKLLCASEPEYLQRHWRAMYEPFFDSLSGMFTADFYFEFMAPGITKGNALAGALPKVGIDASEVIAFGDAQNDISMLEWAGMGVAMGNATEAAKAAADMVTGSNNEDGIASALEKILG
ncbi:Cof-type HAD-IIB family hydrolase [Collinsella intestinalis]|uniref:HAD family phosphatase n=1 Tax=Collinsella intestinalis TaxID=147207 RepID=A0A414FYI7_9ACTN|nr:Cof-type HAD-IIB family hydrolase [Collinsella intestinalis]RHD56564.1 HAD family phosphatase [Collinsella intestinalis]